MKLDQQKFPAIAPVPEEIHRPLWSVMIPTYNRIEYLEQTLSSVLTQAPSPELMQIEVVDNCSTEHDLEALVRDVGKGRVNFYCQPQNVGGVGNFNTCMKRSTGYLVHILHDDDFVLPGFYDTLQAAFEKEPTIGAAFCRSIFIDVVDQQEDRQSASPLKRKTSGIFPDLLEQLASTLLIYSPALVVKRSVYEALGGFHPELFHAGDNEIYKRIAMHYPVWYEPQLLACYRRHPNSHTSSLFKSGENVVNIRRAIEISQSYLPNRITNKCREFEALNAFRSVCWRLLKLDLSTAVVQMREALKCSHSFKVISQMVLFFIVFLLEGAVRRSKRPILKIVELFKTSQEVKP